MLTAVDKGHTPAPRSLTFGEYAASWLEIRSRHVRPITANAYRPHVNHAVRAFGARRLADISRADVERLAAALDMAGKSRRTTGMLLYVVRAIFAAALDDGCVTRTPADPSRHAPAACPDPSAPNADLGAAAPSSIHVTGFRHPTGCSWPIRPCPRRAVPLLVVR
jgi:Phage integrase, N-terminal SAM-like domain